MHMGNPRNSRFREKHQQNWEDTIAYHTFVQGNVWRVSGHCLKGNYMKLCICTAMTQPSTGVLYHYWGRSHSLLGHRGITVWEGFIAYLRFVQFQNINVHPLHVSYCRSFSGGSNWSSPTLASLNTDKTMYCKTNILDNLGWLDTQLVRCFIQSPYSKPAAISPSHVPKRHFTRPGTMLAGATWQGRGATAIGYSDPWMRHITVIGIWTDLTMVTNGLYPTNNGHYWFVFVLVGNTMVSIKQLFQTTMHKLQLSMSNVDCRYGGTCFSGGSACLHMPNGSASLRRSYSPDFLIFRQVHVWVPAEIEILGHRRIPPRKTMHTHGYSLDTLWKHAYII